MNLSRFAIITPASLLLLTACTASNVTTDTDLDNDDLLMDSSSSAPYYLEEDDASSDETVELNVNSASTASSSASQAAVVPVAPGKARVITVNVTEWSFSPAVITAKKGEKVKLQLVGGTGIHSFAVPGLSMNVRVAAGETVTVDLPTDNVGSFDVRCAIPCGSGHRDMKATIVIS